eukprot:jgi/Mesvir1/8553/Mv21215-RA.1
MMAIRRKLPKQFEEPPASAVDHLDEIPRREERVHKRKATLPDYWWHVEYVAGTSALPADEKVTGLVRTRELLRTQMEEDGDPEDDRQKSAVKNLEARIKTRLESARKAKKTEAERSAGGHPVQPPGGVRKDTPRASGGRSEAAQRAAHSVSKHRVTSPTVWTAGTGPGEAHRAAENDFGPAPKRAKPVCFFDDPTTLVACPSCRAVHFCKHHTPSARAAHSRAEPAHPRAYSAHSGAACDAARLALQCLQLIAGTPEDEGGPMPPLWVPERLAPRWEPLVRGCRDDVICEPKDDVIREQSDDVIVVRAEQGDVSGGRWAGYFQSACLPDEIDSVVGRALISDTLALPLTLMWAMELMETAVTSALREDPGSATELVEQRTDKARGGAGMTSQSGETGDDENPVGTAQSRNHPVGAAQDIPDKNIVLAGMAPGDNKDKIDSNDKDIAPAGTGQGPIVPHHLSRQGPPPLQAIRDVALPQSHPTPSEATDTPSEVIDAPSEAIGTRRVTSMPSGTMDAPNEAVSAPSDITATRRTLSIRVVVTSDSDRADACFAPVRYEEILHRLPALQQLHVTVVQLGGGGEAVGGGGGISGGGIRLTGGGDATATLCPSCQQRGRHFYFRVGTDDAACLSEHIRRARAKTSDSAGSDNGGMAAPGSSPGDAQGAAPDIHEATGRWRAPDIIIAIMAHPERLGCHPACSEAHHERSGAQAGLLTDVTRARSQPALARSQPDRAPGSQQGGVLPLGTSGHPACPTVSEAHIRDDHPHVDDGPYVDDDGCHGDCLADRCALGGYAEIPGGLGVPDDPALLPMEANPDWVTPTDRNGGAAGHVHTPPLAAIPGGGTACIPVLVLSHTGSLDKLARHVRGWGVQARCCNDAGKDRGVAAWVLRNPFRSLRPFQCHYDQGQVHYKYSFVATL